jgi:hypothetical protein
MGPAMDRIKSLSRYAIHDQKATTFREQGSKERPSLSSPVYRGLSRRDNIIIATRRKVRFIFLGIASTIYVITTWKSAITLQMFYQL